MSKITKTIVDDLDRHPTKEYFVWDDDIHGLGIRVMPSGCASYFIQYRTPEGKTRRLTLGKVGTLTPNAARDLGKAKLINVATGGDPSRTRHDAREALDVAEVCDLYLNAAASGLVLSRFRTPKRPSTIENDRSRIARHIKPLIGTIPVTKLTRADVQRMADAVAAGKTNGVFKTKRRGKGIVKGGSFSASRVVQMFGGIWTWAERRGYVSGVNPARGVETAKAVPRDRLLSTAEWQALGKVLRAFETVQPAATTAVRLLAYTGFRKEEICGLKWAQVDFEHHCVRRQNTKNGRNARPIAKAALAILADLKAKADNTELNNPAREWVFPNVTGNGSADLDHRIEDIFIAAGLRKAPKPGQPADPDNVRAHDLRRTFTTTAAELGYSDATIDEMTAHARRGVTATHYIRLPDKYLIEAADCVAAKIEKALDGQRDGQPSAANDDQPVQMETTSAT
jgi:integrase